MSQKAQSPVDHRETTTSTGDQLQTPADTAVPPDETVLVTPRGGRFHKPIGHTKVPSCGARAGQEGPTERMTRHRASEAEDCDPCDVCFDG